MLPHILLGVLVAIAALIAWNAIFWPALRSPERPPRATVSILIPARNEQACLDACLRTAAAQDLVAEIVVYDDESQDGTRNIALEWQARDARVRLAPSLPLPAGWCGKPFACSRLALEATSEWLLFIDADARLTPGAVPRMVYEAQRRGATLLSCWPRLLMRSGSEKLLMPLLNFAVFTLYPAPLGLIRRDASLGIAHGACILAEREAYTRTGGHTAVASEIFEDTSLARVWRQKGELSICLDGQHVVEVRMYDGLFAVWAGFQKNFFPAFRKPASFWAFLTLHAVFFLGPFLIASRAALLVILMRLLLALRFRHSLWSALLHPVAECFLIALGVSSWWKCQRGGVSWKGRRYQHS